MLKIAMAGSVEEIAAADWDACAGPGNAFGGNPFIRHAFFQALERSGSANADTGWLPRHLVVTDDTGKVVACAPLYLKTHSYGEYVFDWGWAEAYTRAGGRYYPKLQGAVPFTPVTGPRLLVRDGEDRTALYKLMAEAMAGLADQSGLSSVHVTFCNADEAAALEGAGWLTRLGFQYHWENRGYESFDDFLAQLSSRKRKQVRKEREAVKDVAIRTLVGADVKARHWDVFHDFYQAVVDRKWGSAYLNRAFFEELSAGPLADKVVLVWAEDGAEPLGVAFNMLGEDTLYGRTWGGGGGGGGREVPFLHFEACYYRAIDFAIEHRLKRVEAGAQGEHKVSRGYLPTPTFSAHWIGNAGFRAVIGRHLAHETRLIQAEMAEQSEAGPFRKC